MLSVVLPKTLVFLTRQGHVSRQSKWLPLGLSESVIILAKCLLEIFLRTVSYHLVIGILVYEVLNT